MELLRHLMDLSSEELAAVDGGGVVSKNLQPGDRREIAVAGVTWVRAPKECFVERFSDIEKFKRSPEVLQIRKLSNPFNPGDLDKITLEPQDIEALRHCRIGSCDLKLSASMIEGLTRLNRSAPGYTTAVSALFRKELVGYIRTYLAQGNSSGTGQLSPDRLP